MPNVCSGPRPARKREVESVQRFRLNLRPRKYHGNASECQTAAHSKIGASPTSHCGRRQGHRRMESRQFKPELGCDLTRRVMISERMLMVALIRLDSVGSPNTQGGVPVKWPSYITLLHLVPHLRDQFSAHRHSSAVPVKARSGKNSPMRRLLY
jgi:hypothetical protein